MSFPQFATPRTDAVFAYEHLYQRRFFGGPLKRPGILRAISRWLRRAYAGMALLLAGFVVAYPAAHVVLRTDSSLTGVYGEDFAATVLVWLLGVLPALILIPHVLVTHFSVLFRAMARAANSITREKQSGTWELLLLTGVSTRQIINGKWWATMRSMLPQIIVLALLRSAVILWLVLDSARVLGEAQYITAITLNASDILQIAPYPVNLDLLDFVLVGAIMLLMTLLTTGFAAACGVLASALTGRVTVGIMLALFLRFAVIIGMVFGSIYAYTQVVRPWLFADDGYGYSGDYLSQPRFIAENILAMTAVNALDNGTLITLNLLYYTSSSTFDTYTGDEYRRVFTNISIASQILLFSLGALLTRGVLAVAWWSSKRQGALPVRRRKRGESPTNAPTQVIPPLVADSPPR